MPVNDPILHLNNITQIISHRPECVIKARSIDSFKNLLDQHFSSRLFIVD